MKPQMVAKMAVNIKTEPPGIFSCINVNVMDDDKEKSNQMRRTMIKREAMDPKFRKELKVDVGTGNFQNMMEYREAPASPGASSVHSLDNGGMDNLGSPTTPSSPTPTAPVEIPDERLPNELLDEICEDIGMKEGMELDFVEFLMEQDMVDPQVYMTPEAIRNTLSSVASTPAAQTHSGMKSAPQPQVTSTPKNTDSNWASRGCSSPTTTYSVASSTNCTVATSSGSSSPVAKRFHLSTSGPSSPVRTTAPPLSPHGGVFKAPPTPPTPRRSSQSQQSIASPSISSTVGPQVQRPYSPASVPLSPSQKSTPSQFNQTPGQTQMAPPKSIPPHMHRQNSQHSYQRLGRPAPPNVNIQNMPQQQKWAGPPSGQMPNGMMSNQQCSMNNLGYSSNQQYQRSMDPSCTNGYYSGDTSGVRMYGSSTVSSTVPSTASSAQTAIHSHSYNNRQPMQNMPPQQQKTVHFSDLQGHQQNGVPLQRQNSTGYNQGYESSDCDLENEFSQRNVPSKIMPRLTPSMKSDIAPYMVPGNNNGSMSPYGDYSRGSNSRPGSGDNPMVSMQNDYFSQKPGEIYNVDDNQNSMHMNNYNNSVQHPQQSDIQEPGYRPSCSGGAPIGMQPLRHYDGPNCGLPQGEALGDLMYMDRTDAYKIAMGYCDTQYEPQGQNMNNSCMNMDQKIINSNPGYPGENYCQNAMQNNGPRGIPMQNSHMMGGPPQGNMSGSYDQSQFNNRLHPSANMNNPMYSNPQTPISAENMQCQNPGVNGQNWVGPQPPGMHSKPPHQAMSQGMSMHPQQGMQTPGSSPLPPCTQPNCQSCKTGSPHRPPMLASQQTFIQHLISDRSNAFRSHPLFPLLRDLIIADMNFCSPSFPYQLISNLPADFDKLLQNFLSRNPPSGTYQGNFAIESVIMDALKYAHHCLIEKIRDRQEQDKVSKSTSKSLSAIEEFCEKFDRSVRQNIIKPATFQLPNHNGAVSSSSLPGQPIGGNMTPTMGTPTKDHKYSEMDSMMMQGLFSSPNAKKGLDLSVMCSPHFKSLKDLADCSDSTSIVSSSSNHGKSESKKHPSLPKEAVAIMLEWLRQHKDNPYPNDDEKAMLIKQTGLTINQINYWFTNARRRILPKWAQQCK
ncbi:uncharacterized protein LOC125645987 isoform X2 [Ostrea edulis]|uniref:uncharacterized protein LOC125645987 isoform X2 n=1 Tax=Ostrea edulis TaxID=37623 RepID=UPI0024AF6F06|nr:uncharacterized protein LOC125645987 isoform X2 [Ostrea edulis]